MPNLGGDRDDDDGGDELEREIDEWEPSPLPPIGPDGGPVLTPATRLPVIPETQGLCSSGPAGACARYHRMVIAMDAAQPLDGSTVEHQQVIHTCYPHVGIEVDLGGRHVYECNLYSPCTRLTRPGELAEGLARVTSTLSTPPRAAPRSARAPSKKRRPGRR